MVFVVRDGDVVLVSGDIGLAVQGAPHPRRLSFGSRSASCWEILRPVLNCKTEFGQSYDPRSGETLSDVCSSKYSVVEIFVLVQNL